MKKNKHNYTSIEAFKDEDGRVKITPEVMPLLKPIPTGNSKTPYKESVIRDKHLIGFRAKASPGGQRSFLYRYKPAGKATDLLKANGEKKKDRYHSHITITLGRYYDPNIPHEKDKTGITPAVARKLAEQMRNKVRLKEDPYSVLEARKKGKTLRSVWQQWIDKRLKSAQFRSKKDYMSRFNVYVMQRSKKQKHKQFYREESEALKIFNLPIKTITKDDYINLHTAISRYCKTQANRVMEDARKIEEYALEIKAMQRPRVSFPKKELNKELKRIQKEDPYTPAEIRAYRKSGLSLIREDRGRYLVSVMELLTAAELGTRSKSEVYSLTWNQINLKMNWIMQVDVKNEEPFRKKIDYRTKAILRIMAIHRRSINHRDKRFAYVFPALNKKYKTKYLTDPRKTHRRIIKNAGLKYKCPHFLRHSWATNTYAATQDIKGVASLNNWKDLKSVEIYSKVSDEMQEKLLKQRRNYLSKQSHAS